MGSALVLLETAIAVVFVYLILSLLGTALTEIVESWRQLRGKKLLQVIENMVGKEATTAVLNDTYLKSLSDPKGYGKTHGHARLPSYLPPTALAESLLRYALGEHWRNRIASPGRLDGSGPGHLSPSTTPKPKVSAAFIEQLEYFRNRSQDPEQVLTRVAQWFEDIAERSVGWYRRSLNGWMVAVGFAIALASNADTVQMVERFSGDPVLRDAALEQATAVVNSAQETDNGADPSAQAQSHPCPSVDPATSPGLARLCLALPTVTGLPLTRTTPNGPWTVATAQTPDTIACGAVRPVDETGVAQARACLAGALSPDAAGVPVPLTVSLPHFAAACPQLARADEISQQTLISCLAGTLEPFIGWDGDTLTEPGFWSLENASRRDFWLSLFWKAVGLLLTALAISLGAPFWFDLLRKLVQLRSSAKIPLGRAQEEAEARSEGTGAQSLGKPTGREQALAEIADEVDRESTRLAGFAPLAPGMDLLNAERLTRLMALSYERSPAALDRALAALGLGHQPFQGASGVPVEGFIAWNATDAFVVFRGSDSLEDWRLNIKAKPRVWSPGVKAFEKTRVHQGFLEAFRSVWDPGTGQGALIDGLNSHPDQQPLATRRLWIAGHSLGGALAQLAAAAIVEWVEAQRQKALSSKHDAPIPGLYGVYLVGAPRVGDEAFAATLERHCPGLIHRFINHRDPVPRLAPEALGYRHAGDTWYFDTLNVLRRNPSVLLQALNAYAVTAEQVGNALRDSAGDHSTGSYLRLLRRAIQEEPKLAAYLRSVAA